MSTEVVEAAIRECFLSYAALPEASVDRREDALTVRCGVPLPFFNGVAHTRLDPSAAEVRVRETVATFRASGTPFRWWITPATTPVNLIEILLANGFRHVYDAPGMAMDLSTLADAKDIPGFTVKRVTSADELRIWADVFAEGFARPAHERDQWHAAFVHIGFDPSAAWRHFVGFLDGVPVATTTTCLAGGVAGVYHVATLPRARGRGIGAALTRAACIDAREAGCRAAALQSSEMAYGVYKGLGFRHCCDLTLYDWRPEYER